MLHGDAIAALQSWESKYPVQTWTIRDVRIWPIVRHQLASRILASGRPPTPPTLERPFALRRRPISIHLGDGPRVRPKPVDAVFLSRPANRELLGNVWYDRLFDPIADILEESGKRSLSLEYRGKGTGYRRPRHRPCLEIRPAMVGRHIRAAIGSFLPHRVEFDGFDELRADVASAWPAVRPPTSAEVAQWTRKIAAMADYFELVFTRTQPSVALCAVYYTQIGLAFCLAATRRGILSVDVQHGATVRNPAYDGWTSFPSGGWECLPRRFWCWTARDAEPITSWPDDARPHHTAFVGGHPWAAVWQDEGLPSEQRQRGRALRGSSLNILVALTWSSGFSQRIRQLLRASPPEWTWWIRLHPLMERDRRGIRAWCEANAHARVLVDDPTDLPLPLILPLADVHLTHNSTVVQEAAALGTPSVMIDERALDVYTHEFEAGWAVYADRTEEICLALEAQARDGDRPPTHGTYPPLEDMRRTVDLLLSSCRR